MSSYICLEGLRKTTKFLVWMVGTPAKIRTEDMPHTSGEDYSYVNLFGVPTVNRNAVVG
jgi:hypothetical protein